MTWTIVAAAAWGIIVAGLGAALTTLGPWYYGLRKPSWQPPDYLFGPAWTAILTAASVAFVLAWNAAPGHVSRPLIVVLYLFNGGCNILWSVLFFRLRHPDWALLEVGFLTLSIVALMIGLAPASPLASWLFLPYLLWVSFATFLNLTIVRLNQPFRRS